MLNKPLQIIYMLKLLRNLLAILVGVVAGAAVNMLLVSISPMLIPPPAGVDVNNAESLSLGIHLFEPQHFIMPFLAHALGTLVGALVAYLIAASQKNRFAYVIGVFFLCGGIAASYMIPAPVWFISLDLLLAYLPMAWLGILLARRLQPERTQW
jgi:large-conductance mechanosensitive channel